jgi:hypothetical protein
LHDQQIGDSPCILYACVSSKSAKKRIKQRLEVEKTDIAGLRQQLRAVELRHKLMMREHRHNLVKVRRDMATIQGTRPPGESASEISISGMSAGTNSQLLAGDEASQVSERPSFEGALDTSGGHSRPQEIMDIAELNVASDSGLHSEPDTSMQSIPDAIVGQLSTAGSAEASIQEEAHSSFEQGSEEYANDSFIDEDSLLVSNPSAETGKFSVAEMSAAMHKLKTSYTAASVDEVCMWLSSVELSQYIDAFRTEAVDGPMLRELTDPLLKEELGVLKMGHRGKILRERDALMGLTAPAMPPAVQSTAATTSDQVRPPQISDGRQKDIEQNKAEMSISMDDYDDDFTDSDKSNTASAISVDDEALKNVGSDIDIGAVGQIDTESDPTSQGVAATGIEDEDVLEIDDDLEASLIEDLEVLAEDEASAEEDKSFRLRSGAFLGTRCRNIALF